MSRRRGIARGAWTLAPALALAVSACGGSDGLSGATRPAGGTAGSSSRPDAGSASAIASPRGWKTYSHAGVTFAYPPLPGRVGVVSDGVGGPRHAWRVVRSDRCTPRGECRTYEFAALNDACPAGQPWPTFAHRWIEREGRHALSTCDGGHTLEIRPLRAVSRPDGLRGVIYDANVWFPRDARIPGALAAVLNLPRGFHPSFEAIAFYFEDPTPLTTIETVLRLARLRR